ncbi:TIGR03768 family metallophosphoesterase [Desulfovibrio aerotolerans]|uniref:TIGR03768 family metallophosphoesterase n=1 Tax=Solidesulfovibrio aerotolerans TaxID=295255 RepID=A0A7C9ML24_9BACT|nr:TIGR03768 family metallophosphoesterase [Solidesulfovibrio aerotolerans]MYL84769.1 TIGR03768 family metallophosphoesterase [Solidesulfovibrio aerotolerans]
MALSRRAFLKTGLAGVTLLACGTYTLPSPQPAAAAVIPWTTLEKTVVAIPVPATSPMLSPTAIDQFAQYGYGRWQYAPGLACPKRLDLMPADYTGKNATQAARLLRFFTISDIHITDKESPAQLIYLGLLEHISSAYSPVMFYTTQVLNAAVQTINALHAKDPIDFGISLGDVCNSTQYNELRWYLDILDGKAITPSSGAHAGAETIDYQKPFQAAGLNPAIPWYQALGNHDHFWLGSAPLTDHLRQTCVGDTVLNLGNVLIHGMDSRGFYMGTIDGNTANGAVIASGSVADFATPPTVAPDPGRRPLSRQEWMGKFFNTASQPAGHGFSQDNIRADFACYSFEPKSELPLRVLVLDDTQSDADFSGNAFLWHGSVDQKRWDWLVGELDKGQAEGKLMIIAAHVPIGVEKPGAFMSWWDKAHVTEAALFDKLHTYPNLLLWIAGHRHYNTVTAFPSPDPTRPELGFWQVETSSLRDFPQQFRTFDILRNSDDTISIVTINAGPQPEDGSLAALSRSHAVAAQQLISNPAISSNPMLYLPTGSYNGELVVALSPAMQAKLRQYGTPLPATPATAAL